MKRIKINNPFFGAGSEKQYGWVKDGYHIWGIGVKVEDLGNKELIFEVAGESYIVKSADILAFTEKYNSYFITKKNNIQLAVFSKSLLNNIYIQ